MTVLGLGPAAGLVRLGHRSRRQCEQQQDRDGYRYDPSENRLDVVGQTGGQGESPTSGTCCATPMSSSAEGMRASASREHWTKRPDRDYLFRMPARSETSVKRLTLVACILGSGIALLDGTVVNVALPTIQRALGGGLAAQQWVVNGYLLTLGSLILIGGSLGDLYGERRVFALGVSGFGVASLACRARPGHRGAGSGSRRAGHRWRAARAELAGGDRQHVSGVRAAERRSAVGRRGVRSPACSGRSPAASCWRSPRGDGSSSSTSRWSSDACR